MPQRRTFLREMGGGGVRVRVRVRVRVGGGVVT